MELETPNPLVFDEARQRLGARMRVLRDAASMPQTLAAARAGLDRTTWNRIEHAKMADIKLETLLRIQFALRVESLETLFGETTGDLVRSHPLSKRVSHAGPAS
jgi:transcriptional regulator with XRE-family HTH domain